MKTDSAYYDFCKMVEQSWTYGKMTENERGKCWDALHDAREAGAVKGAYLTRWRILQALYSAFLAGLGYTSFDWREEAADTF